nr:pre-mRNA-splicing factor syf2-like [Cherax quadricarinatus]
MDDSLSSINALKSLSINCAMFVSEAIYRCGKIVDIGVRVQPLCAGMRKAYNGYESSKAPPKLNHTLYFQNEAAALNHKEVVEEDRIKQMPKNYSKKRERLEAEFKEDQRREAALAEGKDYDRLRMLEVGADEAERWERRKKKKNPDQGFSTYEDATIRTCS